MMHQGWKISPRYWRALAAVAAVCLMVCATGTAFAGDGHRGKEEGRRGPYAIGLWGDLPYSTLQATVGVPN